MPDPIPTDDLYARLGVPQDADTPAIDRAWRSLLKRHHPDIAGSLSLELAKLINVAHDWLRDADRRARYDEAVRHREGHRTFSGPRSRATGARPTNPTDATTRRRPGATSARPSRTPPPDAPADDLDDVFGASAPAIRSFLAQAAQLRRSDIDRLRVSEPVDPIAELHDVVPPELWTRMERLDARLATILPTAVTRDPSAATAARGFGHALVLDLFLWYYLADPEPLLEQMRRGWESAVGLPRYGPNTDEVTDLIARLRTTGPTDAAAIAATWDDFEDPQPWPADAAQFDFAALEVSAALARRDAARAADAVARSAGLPSNAAAVARWRRAFASTAHVVTLRPIFPPRTYARYQAALGVLRSGANRRTAGEAPQPTVRRA
jgi:hypothetical protein